MSHLITEFIAAVNAQLLKGKKAAELNALWQTISSVPKCPAIVKAGKREGEACGKSCVKGQPFCLCHTPREVVSHDECSFVLTAGKREGQMCGKSCPVGQMCTAHRRVIVPCEYIMKSGDRQGQACGVTCASGTICKKHIKKATEEIVEEAVQEIEAEAQEQVQVQVAAVAAVAAAEEKENADEIIDNLLEEIADDIIGVLVEEQAIDHHDEIANEIIDVLVEERSAPFGVPERVPIAVAAVATCGAILKSGINKGKACGKNCVSGNTSCPS
jgi:hypothetical protein